MDLLSQRIQEYLRLWCWGEKKWVTGYTAEWRSTEREPAEKRTPSSPGVSAGPSATPALHTWMLCSDWCGGLPPRTGLCGSRKLVNSEQPFALLWKHKLLLSALLLSSCDLGCLHTSVMQDCLNKPSPGPACQPQNSQPVSCSSQGFLSS